MRRWVSVAAAAVVVSTACAAGPDERSPLPSLPPSEAPPEAGIPSLHVTDLASVLNTTGAVSVHGRSEVTYSGALFVEQPIRTTTSTFEMSLDPPSVRGSIVLDGVPSEVVITEGELWMEDDGSWLGPVPANDAMIEELFAVAYTNDFVSAVEPMAIPQGTTTLTGTEVERYRAGEVAVAAAYVQLTGNQDLVVTGGHADIWLDRSGWVRQLDVEVDMRVGDLAGRYEMSWGLEASSEPVDVGAAGLDAAKSSVPIAIGG